MHYTTNTHTPPLSHPQTHCIDTWPAMDGAHATAAASANSDDAEMSWLE